MSSYRYRALDPAGHRRAGKLEAADRPSARAHLREQGLYVVALVPAAEKRLTTLPPVLTRPRGRRFATSLVELTRQLSILLRAGVPLAQALEGLEGEISQRRVRQACRGIRQALVEGGSFAGALERYPEIFDPVYRAMVAAGEATGTLEQALVRLAGSLAKRIELRERIVSAITYPALVSLVGIFVVAFLVSFVVPKVLSVLQETGRPLPAPTQILLTISEATSRHWPLGLLLAAGAGAGLVALGREPRFRLRWDAWQLRWPGYGALLRKHLAARLGELMATLLSAGVPMAEALRLARAALPNRALAELLEQARGEVIAGRSLAESLARRPVLPSAVLQMIAVGQHSGTLPEIFAQMAGDYEREVDRAAARLTAMLEPVLIVCLAAVVGFIVVATMLPILELSGGIQGPQGGML